MDSFSFKHFRQTIALTCGVMLFIFAYFIYSTVSYHHSLIQQKSRFLSDFTERVVTRVKTNKDWYLSEQAKVIGDKKMRLVTGLDELSRLIDFSPKFTPSQIGKISLFIIQFRGLFSISDFVLVYPFELDGKLIYTYFSLTPEMLDEDLNTHLKDKLQPAVFVAVVLVSMLFVFQLIQINKVGRLVNELALWADELPKNRMAPPPKVQDKSLNYLTHTMNASLTAFGNILEKEYSFARFSSHELRGQLAILSANMELLELIMQDLSADEKKVLGRMFVAVEDMKYQTEALLWLSKESEAELAHSQFNIIEIIDKALAENAMVLEPKEVNVVKTGENICLNSNRVLLQIMLNNLVRNAFQNTSSGLVYLAISAGSLTIVNTNSSLTSTKVNRDGFGIGLILVERISEKLGITYRVDELANGRLVELIFPKVMLTLSSTLK
jgi:signal transduction histidine kinase